MIWVHTDHHFGICGPKAFEHRTLKIRYSEESGIRMVTLVPFKNGRNYILDPEEIKLQSFS